MATAAAAERVDGVDGVLVVAAAAAARVDGEDGVLAVAAAARGAVLEGTLPVPAERVVVLVGTFTAPTAR